MCKEIIFSIPIGTTSFTSGLIASPICQNAYLPTISSTFVYLHELK